MNPYRTLRSVVRPGPLETDPVERRLNRTASVADLRRTMTLLGVGSLGDLDPSLLARPGGA